MCQLAHTGQRPGQKPLVFTGPHLRSQPRHLGHGLVCRNDRLLDAVSNSLAPVPDQPQLDLGVESGVRLSVAPSAANTPLFM